MSAKKILVTGGAGYIGAHTTVELIDSGYEPVIIDSMVNSDETLIRGIETITKKKVPFIKGDCRDEQLLEKIFREHGPFHTVIHFAALKSVGESVEQPLRYYDNNIGSLIALLKVMEKADVKNFIFSSSCTVYGQPDHIPVTEEAPFKRAESPYGETKQICEQILQRVRGFSIISLRYFNPIGAHPSAVIGEMPIGVPGNLVPFITQTAVGIREKLTVFGNNYQTADGSCIRDYIHIMDLANAHVKAIDYVEHNPGKFEAFNVGTGQGVSVLEMLEAFTRVNQVPVNYVIGPRRPGDVEKVFADPHRVMEQLKWKPRFSNDDALKHAWAWQKNISGKG